jgi:HEAT repeat protein
MLRSRQRTRREEALERIRSLPTPQATALLEQALRDPHPLIRAAAAEALGSRRAPQAIPSLLDALDSAVENPYLSVTLWEAVESITGREIPFDINEPEAAQRARIERWRTDG